MLFKLKENSPIDIRLLDFQFMRYASAATDLGYYIFGCTTKELREKHYQEFMKTYYETLSEHMTNLGTDPEKIFPRHAFEDQMKKFAKYGILMGVLLVANYVSYSEIK
jgi:Ecdysteroid kinase-like family